MKVAKTTEGQNSSTRQNLVAKPPSYKIKFTKTLKIVVVVVTVVTVVTAVVVERVQSTRGQA
jgi:hypothetical protein